MKSKQGDSISECYNVTIIDKLDLSLCGRNPRGTNEYAILFKGYP